MQNASSAASVLKQISPVPMGHFMTEHTGVTEVLHSVLTWENEMTNFATTPWIEPIALETAAYSDGAP